MSGVVSGLLGGGEKKEAAPEPVAAPVAAAPAAAEPMGAERSATTREDVVRQRAVGGGVSSDDDGVSYLGRTKSRAASRGLLG